MKAQMPPFFWASATVCSASVVLPDDSGPKISTTRPRGRPPMPSAMSRPSEPVETVSTSIDLSFLPSRMIEPLPKLRSIWESAASRAFDLSMEEPSTRRSAAVAIRPTPYAGIRGPTTKPPVRASGKQCTPFVLSSQYVLFQFVGGGRISLQLARPLNFRRPDLQIANAHVLSAPHPRG